MFMPNLHFTVARKLDISRHRNIELEDLRSKCKYSSDGPISFTVLTVEDRLHRRPFFDGANSVFLAGIAPHPREFVYDDDLVDEALSLMLLDLQVFEVGRLEVQCVYHDPQALLEVVGSVGDNTQYRIKSSLTAADNNKIFSINCTAFNRDINRLEITIPLIEWLITLP